MHNVETMAYSGECPWHGLGNPVSNDLSTYEMMVAAGCDWTVSKHPMYMDIGGEKVAIEDRVGLIRDNDNSVLDIVGEGWEPTQNEEAFDTFKEFIEKGNMEMHTAGSLQGGKIVWVMAKVKSDFTLFGGDRVEQHLLFTNPHKFGMNRDVRFTPTRVVCNNTLAMALNGKVNSVFKSSHRVKFNPDLMKETLGITEKKMDDYKEMASFLGSKAYDMESVMEFFNNVFPSLAVRTEKKKAGDENLVVEGKDSRNATQCKYLLESQPGVEFAPGSWWQAFNAVTFLTDHIQGRTSDARVYNAWYGQNQTLKLKAAKMALDFAKKA